MTKQEEIEREIKQLWRMMFCTNLVTLALIATVIYLAIVVFNG